MNHVFPWIVGRPSYSLRQNVKLENLDPLAEDIVVPQPDYYEGEAPGPGVASFDDSWTDSLSRHCTQMALAYPTSLRRSKVPRLQYVWLSSRHARMGL